MATKLSSSLCCTVLFNWVNLYHQISSLEELLDAKVLSLLLVKLFDFELQEEQKESSSIQTLLEATPLPIQCDIRAYSSDIMTLLGFIQTQHQAYMIKNYLIQQPELSFTSHVNIYLFIIIFFISEKFKIEKSKILFY
jgi:hypothetical protein